jgi:hypothetical protein
MVVEGACSSLRRKKIEYNADKSNVFVTTFAAPENDRAETGSLAPLLRGLLVQRGTPRGVSAQQIGNGQQCGMAVSNQFHERG